MTSSYPAHRETNVVLRDGRTMHLRPARPEDRTAVEDYLLRLSPESRRLRFWGVSLDVGETARSAVEIDHEGHETLLALSGSPPGQVVGGAQFISTPGTASAEGRGQRRRRPPGPRPRLHPDRPSGPSGR